MKVSEKHFFWLYFLVHFQISHQARSESGGEIEMRAEQVKSAEGKVCEAGDGGKRKAAC